MSVAWSSSSSSPLLLLSLSSSSSRCPPRPPAQLRLAIHSVLCRTSTTTIHAQLRSGREHWAGILAVEVRQGTLGVDGRGVPCRTSTASIPAQCSLPDLNHDHPRPVFPAGPQPRVSTPKDMPHRVPEDMPDRMLEDMPDRMPEGMPDRMPDRMSDRMPEDMPDKVPECWPDRMPADLPDNMPEDMLDRMPDGMPEDLPDNMPEDMPDRMPDGMPEDMPEHLPEDMPGRMPEDMPDRMPENMSDRMPEDLPVTKCINVMVGITRSKVICFLLWSCMNLHPTIELSGSSARHCSHCLAQGGNSPPFRSFAKFQVFIYRGPWVWLEITMLEQRFCWLNGRPLEPQGDRG